MCACLAFLFEKYRYKGDSDIDSLKDIFIVWDFGGGTFDVTVVIVVAGLQFKAIASEGKLHAKQLSAKWLNSHRDSHTRR